MYDQQPSTTINTDQVASIVLDANKDEILKLLRENRLNLTQRFSELYKNCTIWHLLATRKEKKHYDLLAWFLRNHLSSPEMLDQVDNSGLTPTHWAANNSNLTSILLLAQYAANPTLISSKGTRCTPLDILSNKFNKEFDEKMNEIIRDYQQGRFANINRSSSNGMMACTAENKENNHNAHINNSWNLRHFMRILFYNCVSQKPKQCSELAKDPSTERLIRKKV